MKSLSELKNFRVCIVKHTLTPRGGAEEELLEFLRYKVKGILYISHSFKEAKLIPTCSEAYLYESGVLVKKARLPFIKGPYILFYIKDIFFTLWQVLRSADGFDIYFGVDNLNALSGYILKKIGNRDKGSGLHT